MRDTNIIVLFCMLTLACWATEAAAQSPAFSGELTPTIRALLMLEKPATVTEEQWVKIIDNPANRMDMPIIIYQEETIDLCDLPEGYWYLPLPGRRPLEKQPKLAPAGNNP
ncbi:MAG: hypothetical protein JNL52_12360 [Flavobacteriales bacterium]|nr:hypothetical protein [Flavobacteriales bacterium]